MGLERRKHLRRGVGREEQGFELSLDKIPLLGAQRIEVGLEEHLEGAQIDKIAGLHHLQQGFLIDNAVKHRPQRVVIPAFGGGRDPDHQRPVGMPGPAILQDTPIGRRGGVVRFINDDGLEIRHEASEPGATTERLHTRDHRGGGMLIARRLHDPKRQGGIDQVQFVHRLLDELIAVRQDERPAPAPLDQEGKDNGFARPCGQHEQGPLHPTRRGREQGRHGFVLVGPRGETKCGWWRRHSLHHTRSQHPWALGVPTRCPRSSPIAALKCASGDAGPQRGVPGSHRLPAPRARGLDPERLSQRSRSPLTARRLESGALPTPGARLPRVGGRRR
jgi:hypothetical protein